MAMPVDGGSWRPYVAPPPPPPPPPPPEPTFKLNTPAVFRPSFATPARPAAPPPKPTPDRPLAGFIGPLTADQEVLRSGPPERPLAGFVGPLTVQQEVLRSGPPSILPRNVTDGSQPKSYPTAGLAADDPKAGLITQGHQLKEVDQQAKALATQPIDIEGAKQQVQVAQGSLEQFWVGVYSGLTRQQNSQLQGLAQTIKSAPESQKAAGQLEFDAAVIPMLTSDQRAQLRTLERRVEDSQLHLEGQVIGERLQTAGLDGGFCGNQAEKAAAENRRELVMADARVHVMDVRQLTAQRKVQDANTLLLTPENQQKLAPTQKQVLAAAEQVRLNPDSKQAQQQLTNAKLVHDGALTRTINTADKQALDTLIGAAERERELGALVGAEAETLHQYQDMQAAARRGPLNSTEQRIMGLAEADLNLVKAKRNARELGVAAATSTDSDRKQELLGKLDGSMVELTRQGSDVDIRRAEFNRDVAVHNEQGTDQVTTLVNTATTPSASIQSASNQSQQVQALGLTSPASAAPIKAQPLTVAPEFAMALPSSQLSVKDATEQLNTIQHNRTEFEDKISAARAAQKRASWFEIIVGGLETVAGGVMMATGVGAGFGAALAAHGVYKLSHGIHDLATGKTTDSWVSQGMQALGASKGASNAGSFVFDMGLTAGAGAVGVVSALVRSASWGTKIFGATSGAMMVDGWQAGARTAWDGLTDPNAHHIPFATQGLMLTGMSEQAASEVQLALSAAAPLGAPLARIPSKRAPAFEQGFMTIEGDAAPASSTRPTGTTKTPDTEPVAGQSATAPAVTTQPATAPAAPAPAQPATAQPAPAAPAPAQPATAQPAPAASAPAQSTPAQPVTAQPATPATASTSSTGSAAESSFSYDFYGRKAPADVRQEAANVLMRDRDGDPDKLANQLKRRKLVVERDSSDNIVGAAVLEPNWHGRFGRDSGREKVKPGTTALQYVNGEDGGVRAATAAIEATGRYLPKQRVVAWNSDTLRPGLSDQITDAAANTPIVKRNAPELLAEQGPQPESIHQALYRDDGSALPLPQQLRNLNEIPVEQRGGWPEAAQHVTYKATAPAQPVTFLGSERLGRIFHPIRSKDSVAAWVNNTIHPVKWLVNGMKAMRDRAGASTSPSSPIEPLPSFQLQGSRGVVRDTWDAFETTTFNYLRHTKDAVRNAWDRFSAARILYGGHAKDLFHSIHAPVTTPVGRGVGWLNQHLNPYALQGIEAGTGRAALQNTGYAVRYGVSTGIAAAKRALITATVPQAATGNMDIVVNDNRYLTPWNVSTANIGRQSIAIDFPLTGVRFGAWIGGPLDLRKPYIPGVDAPFTDSENGSMPMARFGAAPTDPNGPKAMRFLTMFRSMLADAGIAVKAGVPEFYVTTSASIKLGTGALSFSGAVPVDKGGQKGLSTLGAFTSMFPQVASSVFAGPFGSVNVSRQTMPAFSLDSTPISAGAKKRALVAGDHYTVGTEKASASSGQFFLLNPSWGKVDPSEARRNEMWRNFNLFNWFG